MSIFSDLLDAWPGLLAVGAGTGLLLLFGRDPKGADEHNVSDYHEPAPVGPSFSFMLADRGLAQMRDDLAAGDILPPAPAGMNAGIPLYAETLFESWRRETPADTAGRFLREIGDSERAKAGIRPVTSPATDRDYTGSFPVVAVA